MLKGQRHGCPRRGLGQVTPAPCITSEPLLGAACRGPTTPSRSPPGTLGAPALLCLAPAGQSRARRAQQLTPGLLVQPASSRPLGTHPAGPHPWLSPAPSGFYASCLGIPSELWARKSLQLYDCGVAKGSWHSHHEGKSCDYVRGRGSGTLCSQRSHRGMRWPQGTLRRGLILKSRGQPQGVPPGREQLGGDGHGMARPGDGVRPTLGRGRGPRRGSEHPGRLPGVT